MHLPDEMKEVAFWSPKEVANWLMENAVPEYCEPLEFYTGQDLINLTKEDFKKPPLSRVSSDNGQRLLYMIETLKMEHHIEAHKNGHANGHLRISTDVTTSENDFSTKIKLNGMPNGYRKEMIKIPMPEPERSQYPMEWGKTLLAFLYALFCFIFTTVTISVVHERVPPKEVQPPLPDAFFDRFNRVQWAFSICEINGMILVGLWLIQWLLLKYKSIISRRFFCIVGTLYLYRCITMYVTTLPVPGMHFNCSPKLFGDWESHLRRIMKLLAGGGLSITGSHNMCGDYLYSGHTVMLTLTYLFIKEYSPRRLWWYHWICWALSIVGMFCILLAHDHYTVDVVVAYYITTRLFWWYHTMANQQVLKEASQTNLLARVWWYRPFQYFEKNVQGIVPRSYHWPFPWPVLHLGRQAKYSRLVNDT
ncbi:phosphatidylcholine:ceramide cholinephosphotransferase 1 isoform X1 [Chrysemys picta bellii]|uniref:Phosphatidylcholine:ceramide cholinephosphotransferase 1 n=1 Tax=Chrysemys picta bellii TaxID=8478 RepID=A0A8C3IVZ0_CHRPI|nr:phosphatidylcholine:ceramide cholinephosphotransferase 1 isoform X1 [Chrysemys picta bellii]XP_005292543.1 phosphatidylcholine:ceramide cholinephosphotransferase 1 isoform X1 [Chrysemys picta bellii]XP_023963032.1 phosphatidylcholine:ceramide cholinephosphotransferase 1 isoform X1 [Chrysemys picta bellii]XP_023963034.1 phosphatidylcholine:ceramide cholinephosphotransferase 1 isoform X1 [Chrysemys picta bellii]XP_023963035.1 phosphatidylcholine:ceramide cholinephosphotransferase 1 isoform X1 